MKKVGCVSGRGGGHVEKSAWQKILNSKNQAFLLKIQFFLPVLQQKGFIITNYAPFSLAEMVKNIEN